MGGIFATISSVLGAVGAVVGIRNGTAEPAYEVEHRGRDVQIRRYSQRVVAETTVSGDEESVRNDGFRRLAGYIFGANHAQVKYAMTAPAAQHAAAPAGERIAMTAPVVQHSSGAGQWTIRFFLPEGVSRDSLPTPNDPTVQLVAAPAETIAVHSFSGDRGPNAVHAHTEKLLNALKGTEFEPSGTPQAWFYDPPWTIPQLRRNEIAVPVTTKN